MTTRRALGISLALLIGGALAAGKAIGLFEARSGWAVDAEGVMLGGFDPVSYFPEGGGSPRLGDDRWTATVSGRRYRFASEANRERFDENPNRFEPQYGGWCAYAVAHGYTFDSDPESYLVENDRLFVFYDGVLGDARAEFRKEGVAEGIASADANWPELSVE